MTDTAIARPISRPRPRADASRPRADAATALLHLALVATLVVSLLTGLQIASDAIDSTWSRALEAVWMQGRVTYWHALTAYALTLISVAYVVFLVRTRLLARVRLDTARVRSAGAADRRTRWAAINVILYWVAFLMIGIAAVTGTLLYLDSGLLPHALVTTIHRVVAWGIIVYAVAHTVAQFILGGIRQVLKILTPRLAYVAAGGVSLAIATAGAAGLLALDSATIRVLSIAHVHTPPAIDGEVSDAVWRQAAAVDIHTVRGANFPGGESTVRVRALHDGQNAYFLFEWQDPTRSQKNRPLVKTADGWERLGTSPSIHDENEYFEDKMAVLLSHSAEIAAAGTAHMGAQPLADRPGAPHQRGLHYTTDGSIMDVWHWKSARMAAMRQLDDTFFGPPMELEKDADDYSGGYDKDPETSGGYIKNWKKLDDGTLVPKYRPRDTVLIAHLYTASLDPNVSDTGDWVLPIEDVVPYSSEEDTFPVGTVFPSFIVEKPFEGDRGDVTAVGTWHDGWWRLEIARRLDTGSKFDLPIADGTYMWVAPFDHAESRHSQHLQPLQLELE
jgi:hypothetical protein